jgi:hypothetical protein
MWGVLTGGLGGACWFDALQELLVESSVIACAVLPVLEIVLELVGMEVLAV